jgi:preprotein translocase subunit SecD
MKSIFLVLFLIVFSVKLISQEIQLKTGFYRITQNDSCLNSNDYLIINDSGEEYCVDINPIVTDVNFQSVSITTDSTINEISYTVGIKLDSSGTVLFKEATGKMVGQKAAFIINNKIVAAPIIRDPIESGKIAVFCDEETIKAVKKALQKK